MFSSPTSCLCFPEKNLSAFIKTIVYYANDFSLLIFHEKIALKCDYAGRSRYIRRTNVSEGSKDERKIRVTWKSFSERLRPDRSPILRRVSNKRQFQQGHIAGVLSGNSKLSALEFRWILWKAFQSLLLSHFHIVRRSGWHYGFWFFYTFRRQWFSSSYSEYTFVRINIIFVKLNCKK